MPDVSHTLQLRVRYSETDQMGTFYNSRALEWFECGRTELFRSRGLPYTEIERRGVCLPLVEAHVVQVQQRARVHVANGVRLDEFHVDELGIDGGCHGKAVARRSHRVGLVELLAEIGVRLRAHLNIRAESTACQHGCFAGKSVFVAGDGVCGCGDVEEGLHGQLALATGPVAFLSLIHI